MLCLIAVLLFGLIIHCQTLQGDTLLQNQQLNDSTTLVSAKGTYVLGFFSPSKNTTRYLGIWYRDMNPQTVVWVANRQAPISSSNGTLTLTTEGILNLLDGAKPIWSTGSIVSTAPKAQLLDSGNFVLTDDTRDKISKPEIDSQFDWRTRSKMLEEISYGIIYLHNECGKKIVHRDLKPGNILLDENMSPRISDFGFAKLCRKDQRSTYTSVFAGTKGYMAPEMLAGKISPKVDVFSFGIIIMEVVTGRLATSFPTGIINHVAKYWMENKELELIDPRIKDDADKEEIIRFIVISMLCVQYDQDKRPDMRRINVMLNSMTTLIPFVPRVLNVDWGISFEEPARLTEFPSVDLTEILTPPSVQSSNS